MMVTKEEKALPLLRRGGSCVDIEAAEGSEGRKGQ